MCWMLEMNLLLQIYIIKFKGSLPNKRAPFNVNRWPELQLAIACNSISFSLVINFAWAIFSILTKSVQGVPLLSLRKWAKCSSKLFARIVNAGSRVIAPPLQNTYFLRWKILKLPRGDYHNCSMIKQHCYLRRKFHWWRLWTCSELIYIYIILISHVFPPFGRPSQLDLYKSDFWNSFFFARVW